MAGLVVYGSLLNQRELKRWRLAGHLMIPVAVDGFQRCFTQEPSWRVGKGLDRAVLNASRAGGHWFNGLLVCGVDEQLLEKLDEWEGGYDRIELDPRTVRAYRPESRFPEGTTHIYAGKLDKQNSSLLPNEDYLQICLAGARQWGNRFHEDFLATTFVKGAVPLKAFLAEAEG